MKQLEEWRPVKGYEGLYEVSSRGRVRNLNYKKKGVYRFKSPQVSNNGYLTVALFKNGIGKRFSVHRLVAIAFIPNPLNLPEVDHIDTDRNNNCVENLRWVTPSENHLNAITREKNSRVWLAMWSSGQLDGCKKRILQLSLDGDSIGEFESASAAARSVHRAKTGIIKTCLGQKISCGGFRWMYKEDYDNRNTLTSAEDTP